MPGLKYPYWIAMIVVASSSACHQKPEKSETKNLFENSIRRDADDLQLASIVHLDTGCTAYFVENSQGKVILGAARHCFGGNEAAWCAEPGTFKDNSDRSGSCKRIVAADANRDILFFEANYQPTVLPEQTYRLADYHPAVNTRLNMLGYPADAIRQAKPTLTENCWVLSDVVPSLYPSPSADPSQRHNCSTYGGNSGGPLFIEGTRDVIGLPFTYLPNYYYLLDAGLNNYSAYLANMADFVALKRAVLEAEGIVISQSQPEPVVVDIRQNLGEAEKSFESLCNAAASEEIAMLKNAVRTEDCAMAAFRLHRAAELNLANQNLTNLDLLKLPVLQTGKLEGLFVQGNPLENLAALATLPQLKYLNLAGTGLANAGDLTKILKNVNLDSLRAIVLDFNAISDVDILKNAKKLNFLSLSGNDGNPETLLASVGQLPQALEYLNLRASKLKSLAGIETSKIYNTLDLANNQLESIEPLSSIRYTSYVASIDLSGNKILNLSPLGKFSALTSLNLSSNPVQDLSPLDANLKLQTVYLGNNPGLVKNSCPLKNPICSWF